MVMVFAVPIRTTLWVERRLDANKSGAETAQHVLQHVIAADAQPLAHHLHLDVAIADVPGETRELMRALRGDLNERFRLARSRCRQP
jgi:hypothetical protein